MQGKCSNRLLHRRGPIVRLFMVTSNFLNFLRKLGDFRFRIGKMMLRQLAAAETTQILHAENCWNPIFTDIVGGNRVESEKSRISHCGSLLNLREYQPRNYT